MATVTIKITNDDGTVADESSTTLPQAVLDLGIAAIGAAYSYKAQVPNPAFISQEQTPGVPETITNPITPARFMTYQWNLFTQEHGRVYHKKQVEDAYASQISQVDSMIGQIVTQ